MGPGITPVAQEQRDSAIASCLTHRHRGLAVLVRSYRSCRLTIPCRSPGAVRLGDSVLPDPSPSRPRGARALLQHAAKPSVIPNPVGAQEQRDSAMASCLTPPSRPRVARWSATPGAPTACRKTINCPQSCRSPGAARLGDGVLPDAPPSRPRGARALLQHAAKPSTAPNPVGAQEQRDSAMASCLTHRHRGLAVLLLRQINKKQPIKSPQRQRAFYHAAGDTLK